MSNRPCLCLPSKDRRVTKVYDKIVIRSMEMQDHDDSVDEPWNVNISIRLLSRALPREYTHNSTEI